MTNVKLVHGLTIEKWKKRISEYVKTGDIQVKVCKYCGAFYLEGKWIDDDIYALVKRTLMHNINKILSIKYPFKLDNYRIKRIEVDNKINIDIEVTVNLDSESFTITKRIVLNLIQSICPKCYAKKVKSYDTIIQVRGQDKLSENDRAMIYNVLRGLPSSIRKEIIDIKTTRDGIDILLNDKGLGRYIARIFERELGANITESYKLVSKKPDGKIKSKLSISVRIPSNSKTLIRDNKDHLLFIYGFSNNGFLAYDFDREKHIVVPFKTYWKQKQRTPNISWRTMRVIGLSKDRVILLDENDYMTYEGKPILSEEFFKDESVSVLEYKGKIYVIKTETLERGLRNGEEKEEKKSRRET